MQSMGWICYFYLVYMPWPFSSSLFPFCVSCAYFHLVIPCSFLTSLLLLLTWWFFFILRFFPFPVIVLVTMNFFCSVLSFRFAFCLHAVAQSVLFILTTSNLYNIAWRKRAKITPPTTISCRHHHKLNDNFLILHFMFIFTFWCFSVHISYVFFSTLIVHCFCAVWYRGRDSSDGEHTQKKETPQKGE